MTDTDTRDLLATIAGLRQQLERVTQERDEYRKDADAWISAATEQLKKRKAAEARAERAEAENARLVEVLDDIQKLVCAGSWDSANDVRRSCIVNEIWWLVENSRAARQVSEEKNDG